MSHAMTPTSPIDAESKIGAVLAALQDGWNRHDMAAFAAQFSQDADFVNVVGMHLRGRPAIEAQHVAIHQTVFRRSQLRTVGQSVRLLTPQVALAHVSREMTGHDMSHVKNWSLPEVRKGVLTAVLVSEGDTWRIAALHNTDTVPLSDSGK
jgi:uncharacterized protein (TIGR02246 family)